MTRNALCKSQHESQAFLCTERTDCVASGWNACWSLCGAVLADIILLDCWRSGRTRTESKAPSLYVCSPVILLLLFVHIINRNPIHSEFFSSVFSIECCYFKSAVLPFWLLGNRRFSSCAQNDMIRGPAEQGPGGDSEDISVLSCDGGTKKLLTKSILENFSHIMAREKNQYFFQGILNFIFKKSQYKIIYKTVIKNCTHRSAYGYSVTVLEKCQALLLSCCLIFGQHLVSLGLSPLNIRRATLPHSPPKLAAPANPVSSAEN